MLLNYAELLQSPSKVDWPVNLVQLDDWISDFLCKPHQGLKRTGAVCPFVLPALKQKRILITHLDLSLPPSQDKKEFVIRELDKLGDDFKACTSSEEYSLDCLIITLTGIENHERRYAIDQAQEEVKAAILRRKLMVGGFYPLSNKHSRRNQDFYPMRSPLPMFAIRHMVNVDRSILTYKKVYLEIYNQFYS